MKFWVLAKWPACTVPITSKGWSSAWCPALPSFQATRALVVQAVHALAARVLSHAFTLQSGPTLLERLGLPNGAVRNVVMNNDIVPRAFACDYTLVANLLARVGEGFRGHACLQNPNGRKARPPERAACCAKD